MINTTSMLLDELHGYASPKSKLSRMVKTGEVIPIIKGLYETDRTVPPYLLAGSIYGPSYISFEFALSFYEMIPEAVYTVTCATFHKKKAKRYDTAFGMFSYRDVPDEAFPLALSLKREGKYYFRIAMPEKALCDKLYTLTPVSNMREMGELLTENLRIEEEALENLDLMLIEKIFPKYHSTNVRYLCSFLRRLHK